VAAAGPIHADAGLTLAHPAALPAGLATGVALGAMTPGVLGAGLRASYASTTEYALSWATTHSEVRLRACGQLSANAGRGTLALRLGAGTTIVRESRDRAQAGRLGSSGQALSTSAWGVLPAAELEAGVQVRVVSDFGVAIFVGPTAHLLDGAVRAGFGGHVGIAWLP
jgi:hypothetical protein